MADTTAIEIQNDAWKITTCIINLGATFGLTLPRWEETVCVMIEKAPGNLLLNKLRRIFIMASDYNLALGTIVGRRLLWRAEDLVTYIKISGELGRIVVQMTRRS